MNFEEFLIKNNYFEKISDLRVYGFTSEQISKQLTIDYLNYISNIRNAIIDKILED